MTYADLGSVLHVAQPRHERLILESLYRSRKGNVYWGIAYDYRLDVRFRVIIGRWFPIGTVVVCDSAIDIDCFCVDVAQTILENGYSQTWLDDNEPGGGNAFQIPLFPPKKPRK